MMGTSWEEIRRAEREKIVYLDEYRRQEARRGASPGRDSWEREEQDEPILSWRDLFYLGVMVVTMLATGMLLS